MYRRPLYRCTLALLGLLLLAAWSRPALAQLQVTPAPIQNEPLALTLNEAIQIALVNNYAVRNNLIDLATASAQVREAWGQVYPQVSASASYTRNVVTANPFAGSQAGGLFASFGFIDWLSYNERARTDDDPSSTPIPYDEFLDRQQEGLNEAGITMGGSDNPFGVDNQFSSGITISQTLFDGGVFVGISAAERLQDAEQQALLRQQQLVVDQVRQQFYQALLAQQQADVVGQSVGRTQATLNEVARQVTQGVAPKYQRLSAEVSLANLETQLLQTQNQAAAALDNLKFTLGIPIGQTVRLRGDLEVDDADLYQTVSVADAFATAVERRPDLERARIAVDLREINKKVAKSNYIPRLSAFANFNYTGSVPDNRTFTISDPNDPFSFSQGQSGFFSSSYWNPSVNVGLQLSWNLFDGFQRRARIQQRQLDVERAELDYTQLAQSVQLEVEQALRDLETARQQILSQERNVSRAELNYEHARARLREGVATQLEERDASGQLDQSRLNYLQAVHDYLVARSTYETALGTPLARQADMKLTSN